jgi:23S rRNA (cytosine1962-C5)-methyltransferase
MPRGPRPGPPGPSGSGPVTDQAAPSSSVLELLTPSGWQDYELLDSGQGRKLERFAAYVLDRPEPNALWRRRLPPERWREADARFEVAAEGGHGEWSFQRPVPERWEMRYQPLGLRFYAACRPFRHVGVFPEQAAHWIWLVDRLKAAGERATVLVLFGYTGLATLALARGGAEVVHVDASKPTMAWARDNARLSNLEERPIRWLLDDAHAFVQREARRGHRYDGIVMDPPAYGRGPKGETWRFQSSLPQLIEACADVLSPDPLLFLVNAYAVPASATMLRNLVQDLVPRHEGLEAGELAVEGGGRTLATGIFARWAAV